MDREALERLDRVFASFSGVEAAVYLFGSAATGRTHGESDLDLAVVPRGPEVRGERVALLAELERQRRALKERMLRGPSGGAPEEARQAR